MNEIQKQAVADTIEACFPDRSEQFKTAKTALLSGYVESRNHVSAPRPHMMSMINRTMWNTYNLILNGPRV